MRAKTRTTFATALAAILLSGCGGSEGTGIVSAPPPPASSPPSGNLLSSSNEFATYAVGSVAEYDAKGELVGGEAGPVNIRIRYSPYASTYEVELPGITPGQLVADAEGIDGGRYKMTDGLGSSQMQNATVFPNSGSSKNNYSYTRLGFWIDSSREGGHEEIRSGHFVYGIPTASGDVPRTGSASYDAKVFGESLGGTARLDFDFGAGSLSGYMDAILVNRTGFGEDEALPRYTFRDTVYSAGATNFEGKFLVPGSDRDSHFQGLFTGPQAAELMARFQAPYRRGGSTEWGEINGVWIGKVVR